MLHWACGSIPRYLSPCSADMRLGLRSKQLQLPALLHKWKCWNVNAAFRMNCRKKAPAFSSLLWLTGGIVYRLLSWSLRICRKQRLWRLGSMLRGQYSCSNHRNWYWNYFANRMNVVLIQKSREIWQRFFNRLFWDQNFKQKSNALSRCWYFCTTPTGQEGCSLFGFSEYGHASKMSPKTECSHSRRQHTTHK